MTNLKFEIKRKLFHLSAILYVPLYYFLNLYYSKTAAITSLLIILIFFITIEYFRLKHKKKIPIFHILYRKKENNKISANIYFAIAAILSFAFLDFSIASTVILMTTFGDMAAAIIGIKFGKHWLKDFPDRAWEGVIAEFLTDFIIVILVLNNLQLAIMMAFVATLVETTLNKFMDDNLSIPLFAGITGQTLKLLFS